MHPFPAGSFPEHQHDQPHRAQNPQGNQHDLPPAEVHRNQGEHVLHQHHVRQGEGLGAETDDHIIGNGHGQPEHGNQRNDRQPPPEQLGDGHGIGNQQKIQRKHQRMRGNKHEKAPYAAAIEHFHNHCHQQRRRQQHQNLPMEPALFQANAFPGIPGLPAAEHILPGRAAVFVLLKKIHNKRFPPKNFTTDRCRRRGSPSPWRRWRTRSWNRRAPGWSGAAATCPGRR